MARCRATGSSCKYKKGYTADMSVAAPAVKQHGQPAQLEYLGLPLSLTGLQVSEGFLIELPYMA